MPDTARREAMLSRARTLRTKANDFMARCKDRKAKLLVNQMVLNHVDDVERFFLGDPKSTLSVPQNETMWLNHAEMVLGWGEQGFASLERQFAAFGGPEKVQVI